MAQITFTDKVALNVNADIPEINKITDANINEIKAVVNENEVQSGSNANGNWIKYSDGTLIQRGGGQCPANVAYVEVTYPIPFIDTNYTIIASHKYTGGSGYGGSTQNNNIVVSQAWHNDAGYIYSNLPDLTAATYPRNVQYIAIGRWK